MTIETFGVHTNTVLSDRVNAFGVSVEALHGSADRKTKASLGNLMTAAWRITTHGNLVKKTGNRNYNFSDYAKRFCDFTLASLALVFLLPLITFLMVVLLIAQGRPLFIGHKRIGQGGNSFPCFKLRSMVTNADEVLRKHLSEDAGARQEWHETHKLKNDPRITPLGKFLRKSSVDELPQLLNVIRGEMSLVGPRPIVREEISRYGDHFAEYQRVRPGLTGSWQVSGRSDTSYQERVRLDVQYVQNRGFWRDLAIMFKTIPALLKSSGSY